MTTKLEEPVGLGQVTLVEDPNGAALAAFVAAGIGSFAMGMIVVLNESGIFSAPSIYALAGGVSGRTTSALVIWVIAWVVLHARWKNRAMDPRIFFTVTVILIAMGLLGTFPPMWALL